MFIASNVVQQTAGYSTGRIPRRLHFLLGLGARPPAVLLAGEKRPIRAFTAGINIAHCPRQRAAADCRLPAYAVPNYLHFYLTMNTWTILSWQHSHKNKYIDTYVLNYAHFVFVYLKEDVPIDVR